MNIILRRRKLGRTSCREIAANSEARLRVVRNDRGIPDGVDTVFRWGCTTTIPENVLVVNSSRAIHRVNDKKGFRMLIQEATPTLVPETFTSDTIHEWQQDTELVVRPSIHSRGRRLWVAQSREHLRDITTPLGTEWYASDLIQKIAEYRVAVVSGRAVWVAQKTPGNPDDIAWNVALGGRFDNVSWDNWPLQAVRKSIEAFNLSGLDFGGVDVMVGEDGTSYIIEINSAPSLTSPYRQQCFARAFDYILWNGKETIPLVDERGGYRKFIHPAVCDRAILRD